MVPLMNQACDTFMSKLEKVADHEESVDIHEWVSEWILAWIIVRQTDKQTQTDRDGQTDS